jgi:DNA-binding XRE family transcriptional regulator
MNIHTKHQVIKKDGVPLFVIVPYDEYIGSRESGEAKTYLPQAVVEKAAVEGKSMVRAWREFKKMSQKEVADRLGITQAAFCQLEKAPDRMRGSTVRKIAAALGVTEEQLIL